MAGGVGHNTLLLGGESLPLLEGGNVTVMGGKGVRIGGGVTVSGGSSDLGPGGNVVFVTGRSKSASSGILLLASGQGHAGLPSGQVHIKSGVASDANSGDILISTGQVCVLLRSLLFLTSDFRLLKIQREEDMNRRYKKKKI